MGNNVNPGISVNPRSVIVISLLSIAYFLISYFMVGFQGDQVVLVFTANILFYLNANTRKFLFAYLTFLVYWVIFDYMKAFPNYNYNPVHIADLYNFEKHIFGININGQVLTPNEYLKIHSNSLLDMLSGIFYLCWIPVPFGFGIYLFTKNRRECLYFLISFVTLNILGFIVYYSFPAAPPWYVQEYGFVFHPNMHEGIAGLDRFDQLVHAPIFKGIYTKGSNVFAAMPSLHSAYPIVVFYYAVRNRMKWAALIFGIVTMGIWFGAVYTSHHYILDVLAGILCATAGIALFNLLNSNWQGFKKLIDRYVQLIEK